jgi:hypothetical protein
MHSFINVMYVNRGLVYDNAMEQVGHQPDDFWKPDEIRVGQDMQPSVRACIRCSLTDNVLCIVFTSFRGQ